MGVKSRTGYEKKKVVKPELQLIKCKECRVEVKQVRRKQVFCSPKCRLDNWIKLHPRITLTKEEVDGLQKLKLLPKVSR